MLFQSFNFIIFFVIVFILFFVLRTKRHATLSILVISSLIFYGFSGLVPLLVLLFVGFFDYSIGHLIYKETSERKRKIFFALSLLSNIGILCYFKYANFFIESLNESVLSFNSAWELKKFNVLLPVGISFYIFESLSYVIDVYKKKYKPRESILEYILFISYFPHLISGPIIRPGDFFSQISKNFEFKRENFQRGLFRFAVGVFKKIFIADLLSTLWVSYIFRNFQTSHGLDVFLAVIGYAFQVYFDFSGYTDMALGLSRVFGIELNENFKTPYFSSSPKKFWRRWHISLSLWLRDYVYIPMGGSRFGFLRKNFNILFTMFLVGLWHGPRWTFVFFGIFHGLLLVGSELTEGINQKIIVKMPAYRVLCWVVTFISVAALAILTKIESMAEAGKYFSQIYLGWGDGYQIRVPWAYLILLSFCFILHGMSYYGLKQKLEEKFALASYWIIGLVTVLMLILIVGFDDRLQPFVYYSF